MRVLRNTCSGLFCTILDYFILFWTIKNACDGLECYFALFYFCVKISIVLLICD
jgi:hypothetical protein